MGSPKSVFADAPMKAIVGKSKTIFYVHPGVLRQGISALTAMVAGPWHKAGEKVIDWSCFDEETINCVLGFCYGQRPYCIPWQSAINNGESVPESVLTKSDAEEDAEPKSSPTIRSYTGDAIVLHAKVYSFAHHYLVDDLQSFALMQMKDCFEPCLKEYSSSPKATCRCLADAIQIIYGNTFSSNNNVNPARKQISGFIAASYDKLSHYFAHFHEDTGTFMIDLAFELSRLLQSMKADLISKEYQIDALLPPEPKKQRCKIQPLR
ncbi:uncharacterized protein N7479_006662 [Penicillium vulpinum]|uniref:uncharacterized protein n=1 Tax=Penicillium vulpinum TaxID=29845 RepID=UPI002547963E|nr:uncharacterized protein N7479_006662 [Penicillium vulpinum]KAJ5959512.1 hypothetical protein N7479_006662 [Penicillium vulpinum]